MYLFIPLQHRHSGLLTLFAAFSVIHFTNGKTNFHCPPKEKFVDVHTKFYVVSRELNITVSRLVTLNDVNERVVKTKSLVVIIGDAYDKTPPIEDALVKAYVLKGSDNLIYVKHMLTYWKVNCPFTYSEIIANTVKTFIEKIYTVNPAISAKNTHLIGNGMGAIIAGHTALQMPKVKINRVTGLDPTLYYSDIPSDNYIYSLRPGLAEFTDIYHTNVGMIGRFDVLGDVDIYFNNDVHMPGCNGSNICSHKRAVEYYAETIYSLTGMWGMPCFPGITFHYFLNRNVLCKFCSNMNDLVLIGEYMPYHIRGAFKVLTNFNSPYATGRHLPFATNRFF